MTEEESSPSKSRPLASLKNKLSASKIIQIFGIADFRYYWIGAFVSFSGSWIQRIAEGYFVFQLTGDESKLAFVSFSSSIPVFFFGFAAGSVADSVDRKKLLVIAQILYFLGATYLAIATWRHFVTYGQILFVAFLLGIVATVEMPARQSIVSQVVPPKDLSTAIPITAMTFNAARIVGPAMGTWVLSLFGVAMCYFLNGISFLALVWVVLLISVSLKPVPRPKEPVKDVIFEGARYTFKDVRLRTLFILETISGVTAIFYLSILPAITGEGLGLDKIGQGAAKAGLGIATTFVGIGAIIGLLLATRWSQTEKRHLIIKGSITLMGVSLILLSFIKSPFVAYPIFAFMGAGSILQFNTTNALFQILAPEERRGRVLAMHIWTLNGLSPIGAVLFGYIARISHRWPMTHYQDFGPFRVPTNVQGTSIALLIGGILTLFTAVGAWLSLRGLSQLSPDLATDWTGRPRLVT